MSQRRLAAFVLPSCIALLVACAAAPPTPAAGPLGGLRAAPFDALDASVHELMRRADVPGLALALIRGGRVVHVQAYGVAAPASGALAAPPLRTDTVMYGASLTKAAFAHLVMQLVDQGLLDLDRPIAEQLRQPLPAYPEFADLAGDPRWRAITLRMLLSHSSGLLNWRWINADGKLDFKYAPGERYVYSGEGLQIAQLLVEERSGQPLAELMQRQVFDRFGMPDTSMVWRDSFAGRLSTGFGADGSPQPQRRARRARAAGSMVTTVADYAAFLAGVLRREGLSPAAQQQMLAPQIAIVSPQQFPSHFPGRTDVNDGIGLAAGLGWVVYRSPRGPAFFKEGNDEGTTNFALGFADSGDGLVLLSNSSHGDRMFYPLVELLFAPSCLPWFWMGYVPYDRPALRSAAARQRPLGPDAGCPAPRGQ